jgi:ADP-ribose pyrophosphatase YjhB (NUDIX family)
MGVEKKPMKFCSQCGGALSYRIPPGDDRPRYVCNACGTVHYENPKVVVGCIPVWKEKILLCRRAIEPGHGKWTLPAGYLENGETAEQGAVRETFEEAGSRVEIVAPYALFSLTFADHIYFMFHARMLSPHLAPGKESLSARLFSEPEIPWSEIAFKVISETLRHFLRDRARNRPPQFQVGEVAQR